MVLDKDYKKEYEKKPTQRVRALKNKLGCGGGKSTKSSRFFSNFNDTFKGVRTFYDMKTMFDEEKQPKKKAPTAKMSIFDLA